MERDSCRRPVVDELDPGLEHTSLVSGLATLGVACGAIVLAGLPAIVALRLLELPVGWVGAALGCVGAAAGGVKLIAMAWAVGGRLSARPPARAAAD